MLSLLNAIILTISAAVEEVMVDVEEEKASEMDGTAVSVKPTAKRKYVNQ